MAGLPKLQINLCFCLIEGTQIRASLDINEIKNIKLYENIKVGEKISVYLKNRR